MNSEKNDQTFSSLLRAIEQVASLFRNEQTKHYPVIQQELIKCYQKIDTVFALEMEANDPGFLAALSQQRLQLSSLINMTEEIIKEETQHNSNNCIVNKTHQHCHRSALPKLKPSGLDKPEMLINDTIKVPRVGGLREIVGLHEIKKVLRSLVILPKTQPQLFINRQLCNTILLYGPPGTGKTRLVHGLAAEANAIFHCVSAGDILGPYIGQSEKTIKSLFQYLGSSCELTILFIDEIDAFCRKRTESERDHTRRLKTEFMCQMSNIEDCKNIFIVCATNCPWDLDSAILRRLQKRIYVPLPNRLDRLEMFQFLTKNCYFEEDLNDWNSLLQKTDGYSGSDLFNVVQTAQLIPLKELEDTKIWKRCSDGFFEPVLGAGCSNVICCDLSNLPANSVRVRKVQMNDLLNATDTVRCTVTRNDMIQYECFNST